MKIAIIGGGLAGASCAYVLRNFGLNCTIYEAGDTLAPGASGNKRGLYNPRFSAHRTEEAKFYASAYAMAYRAFEELEHIDWSPAGALHLITDEKKEKRFSQMLHSWEWPEKHMRHFTPMECWKVAGVKLQHEAIFLPQSGSVSPQKLCEAYATSVDIQHDTKVEALSDIDADIIILACGVGILGFNETDWLPLQGVRGQITEVAATEASRELKCNLCYSGYITTETDGIHMVGSTFQRWLNHEKILPEDDEDNLAKLEEVAPELAKGLEVVGSRAAIRTASKDQFPVVGAVPGHDNLYVSTAHGSHGIISSLISASLIADMILGKAWSLPASVVEKLKPARFGGPV